MHRLLVCDVHITYVRSCFMKVFYLCIQYCPCWWEIVHSICRLRFASKLFHASNSFSSVCKNVTRNVIFGDMLIQCSLKRLLETSIWLHRLTLILWAKKLPASFSQFSMYICSCVLWKVRCIWILFLYKPPCLTVFLWAQENCILW
jgi:hypothetical protein